MNQFKNAKIANVVFALVIFSLVANIVFLGVTGKHFVSGDDIAKFADGRGEAQRVEYATRGEIYTSDNQIIAANVQKFKLIAIVSDKRKAKKDEVTYVKDIKKTAKLVAPIIKMDPVIMEKKLKAAVAAGQYQIEFGNHGSNLSANEKKQIEETELPGLEFIASNSRNYPLGNFCSYIIGYAQNIEKDGIKSMTGKMGLEAIYDKTLAGKNGHKVYQIDTRGYILPNGILKQEDAIDGQDIYLTLNSSLQRDLDYALANEASAAEAKKAAAVVMEAKTGKILALSNYPSFNPNDRDIKDYKNFFFDTAYECGSVFKPFVYASSIESGLYKGDELYMSGKYDYGARRPIRDHNGGTGWGMISYDEGFYRSSNVAICNLLEGGFTKRNELVKKYHDLGFFKSSNIDGFESVAGTELYKHDKSRAAYLTTGFGQGSTVTMLQLVRAYSVFANDGKMVEPHIVDRIVDKTNNEVTYSSKTEFSKQIFSASTVAQVRDLLKGVVSDETGTAKQFALDNGVQIIGKTGTGQMVDETGHYSGTDYTKSFAGMAPYDDPQIITIVVFQGPNNDTTQHQANIIKNIVPSALSVVSSYDAPDVDMVSEDYKLDSYINQSVNFVKSKLESKSINVQTIGTGTTVIEQYPKANTKITKNDRFFIKTESPDIALPDFTGWSRKDVLTFGSLSGLNITTNGDGVLASGQSVAPGTIVHSSDSIIINLQ